MVAGDGMLVAEPQGPEDPQRVELGRDGGGAIVLFGRLVEVTNAGVAQRAVGDDRDAGAVERVEDIVGIRAGTIQERLIRRRIARELETEGSDYLADLVPNHSDPPEPSASSAVRRRQERREGNGTWRARAFL
jgi:hypothetical protein